MKEVSINLIIWYKYTGIRNTNVFFNTIYQIVIENNADKKSAYVILLS